MFPPLSKRSKRGLLAIMVVMFVFAFLPRFLQSTSSNVELSKSELRQAKKQLKKKTRKQRFVHTSKNASSSNRKKYAAPPVKFDPNTYTKKDWTQLGVSEKQADVIVNFIENGIYSNADLQQIYVLPEELFTLIKDSTFYPPQSENSFDNTRTEKGNSHTPFEVVELNAASEKELLSLYGIGPFYAKKIIEYREELGGYISKEQLLEIWKFDAEKLKQMTGRIKVNKSSISKININTISKEELKKHPYFSWNKSNSLINMRNSHGKFANFNDLKKSKLIDDDFIEKVKPYIQF